jgi:uncharacterized protein YgiM (DUF1202 family)
MLKNGELLLVLRTETKSIFVQINYNTLKTLLILKDEHAK